MHTPRVIVALDYPSAAEANVFVDRVSPEKCRLKVGLELYTASGPEFLQGMARRGFRVFLDLKFHDIPNTVEHACRRVTSFGVELLTVHCLGGRRMLEAARKGVGEDSNRPRVLGVTLLTSHDATDLKDIGVVGEITERTLALARLAHTAGLDGVICAPTEAKILRRELGPDFLLVTPGIRPAGDAVGDQRRVATPREAVANGADLLVIGRPITQSADPVATLASIERELRG